jgi:hypothetical protein
MQAPALCTARRSSGHRPTELLLVRANAPLFFSVAAASLLEASASLQAERLARLFGGNPAFCGWLERVWIPSRLERAGRLRAWLEGTWPEFDWTAAFEQYRSAIEMSGPPVPYSPDATHAALAGCIASAQAALYYRTLARWGDDRRLRELAGEMAQEEARLCGRFRAEFERARRTKAIGFADVWRTATACVRTGRDMDVRLAFETLLAQWPGHAPFPRLDYSEFVERMRAVILRAARPNLVERLMFRAWSRPVRLESTCAPAHAWPKPALAAAG